MNVVDHVQYVSTHLIILLLHNSINAVERMDIYDKLDMVIDALYRFWEYSGVATFSENLLIDRRANGKKYVHTYHHFYLLYALTKFYYNLTVRIRFRIVLHDMCVFMQSIKLTLNIYLDTYYLYGLFLWTVYIFDIS